MRKRDDVVSASERPPVILSKASAFAAARETSQDRVRGDTRGDLTGSR